MKNRIKTIMILIGVVALFTLIFSGAFGKMTIFWIAFVVIIAEAIFAICYTVKKQNWVCEKCGTEFSPKAKEVIFGINGGTAKQLFCPKCQKKTWCKPTPKKK